MSKSIVFLIAGIFVFPLFAVAECSLNLVVPQEIRLEPRGWTHSSMTVSNVGNADCSFFVTFSEKQGSGGRRRLDRGGASVIYEIYGDASRSRPLRDLPHADLSQVLSGTVTGVQKFSTIPFFIERPDDLLHEAGLYRDHLEINIYEGTPRGEHRIVQRRNLRLLYEVPQEVLLSLVEPGVNFTANDVEQLLDFGDLSQGKARSFDVVVKANTDFDLFFLSENRGKMKHAKKDEFVPYKFFLNGVSYPLANELKNSKGFDQSAQGFYRNEVRIAIGEVLDRASGRYEDNITITVVAK